MDLWLPEPNLGQAIDLDIYLGKWGQVKIAD